MRMKKDAELNTLLRSLDGWRSGWHHHGGCIHQKGPALYVALIVHSIVFTLKQNGEILMKVNLTWTTPITRLDGSPLALADIKATNVSRNGVIIASPIAVAGVMTFSDSTPLTGSDAYVVDTVTTDGLVSADSNEVTITVANANPAAAITDLAGVLVP